METWRTSQNSLLKLSLPKLIILLKAFLRRVTLELGYMHELRKKRQHGMNNYYGIDELLEERRQVNQQQMKTPGRRGELIKHEEIDKEILRRLRNET